MNPQPPDDLLAFVNALIGSGKKPAASKRKPFINRERIDAKAHRKAIDDASVKARPIDSSRWTDEAIVLLRRHTTCACGSEFIAPSDNVFIRRFHPTYGLHFTPIPLRSWSAQWLLLPRHIETHEVSVAVCCNCFERHIPAVISQQQLIFDQENTECLSPSTSPPSFSSQASQLSGFIDAASLTLSTTSPHCGGTADTSSANAHA